MDEMLASASLTELNGPARAAPHKFKFLEHSLADGNLKKTQRKAVRSHATAYGHRTSARKVKTAATKGRRILLPGAHHPLSPRGATGRRSPSPGQSRRPTSRSGSNAVVRAPSDGRSTAVANEGRRRAAAQAHHLGPRDRQRLALVGDLALEPADPAAHPSSTTSTRDPFSTYPVPFQKWYGRLIDYWYGVVLPQSWHRLKATHDERNSYTIWSRREELTEPALYYMSLFLASGIPVSQGKLPLAAALLLRQKTVEALNDAIKDPKRATSNAIILTIGRIALHEHIYGDRSAALTQHRPAQQRLIAARGGVSKLGLPRITLQLMLWYDALMAAESGTPALFVDVPTQVPGVQAFSGQEAMNVTNEASPSRHLHPGYK